MKKIQGQNAHKKMETQGKTCIDCHYNLVHKKVPWPEKEKVSGELDLSINNHVKHYNRKGGGEVLKTWRFSIVNINLRRR